MQLRNDHNVYILGAGFSADAGLPLLRNFLLRMRDGHHWLINQRRIAEAQAVETVLKFRLEAAAASYWVNLDLENIEHLFSLASASSGTLDDSVRVAIAATLDFCTQERGSLRRSVTFDGDSKIFLPAIAEDGMKGFKFLELSPTPTAAKTKYEVDLYTFYVARLLGLFSNGVPAGENTFVTFNYDTLVEEALHDLGLPFTYRLDTVKDESSDFASREANINVLKLHGSLNWARRQRELTIFRDYSKIRAEKLIPELIPPTWKKVIQNELQSVWDASVNALKTATRVIVIGFSMPETDQHFRYLLAAGFQSNVSLREIVFVNPVADEQFAERVGVFLRKGYFDSRIHCWQSRLDEFTYKNGIVKCIDELGRPRERNVGFSLH